MLPVHVVHVDSTPWLLPKQEHNLYYSICNSSNELFFTLAPSNSSISSVVYSVSCKDFSMYCLLQIYLWLSLGLYERQFHFGNPDQFCNLIQLVFLQQTLYCTKFFIFIAKKSSICHMPSSIGGTNVTNTTDATDVDTKKKFWWITLCFMTKKTRMCEEWRHLLLRNKQCRSGDYYNVKCMEWKDSWYFEHLSSVLNVKKKDAILMSKFTCYE